MAERRKTADPKQGFRIIGLAFLFVLIVGYAVLPMFDPVRSKLIGKPAPDFTLPVMYKGEPGSRLSMTDLRGRVVVLDFWASWCAPCRAQIPILDRVARKHGDEVAFVGVSTSGDDWGRAVRFVQSQDVSYPSVFDKGDRVGHAYRVRSLPTLVVVDPKGDVAAVRTRVIRERELEELISDAMGSGEA